MAVLADPPFRGFLVHAYTPFGPRRNGGQGAGGRESRPRGRIFLVGRLEDGRSFAAALSLSRAGFHIARGDLDRCSALLRSLPCRVLDARLESFSGREDLVFLDFDSLAERGLAFKALSGGGIQSPDGAEKAAETFLMERQIHGWLEISGPCRPGRGVDLVFAEPEIRAPGLTPGPAAGLDAPPAADLGTLPAAGDIRLRIASVDIETDTKSGAILAIGTAWADGFGGPEGGRVRVLGSPAGGRRGDLTGDLKGDLVFHPDEAGLLRAFLADIRGIDPDVLTGWNFLDFDFRQIALRCAYYHIPLFLGRSDDDEAKYFPPGNRTGDYWGRGNSAAALVPGRQVLDALRIFRAGGRGFLAAEEGPAYRGGFSLEAVSRRVLGEGKLVSSQGEEKIGELEKLYAADPVRFGAYCLRDAELVLRVLEAAGLFRLTVERANLTAVSLDKAWTSVVSFERIYGMELRRRGIAPPFPDSDRDVSGAAGGTVLDSLAGLFKNIAVFDFRSLYPTIMRTFNIDPLCHDRAALAADPLRAPNGAAFSREPGPLPDLITAYFAERRKAIDRGNETAAQVYKILMNSFYGVLGTSSCRYGRTELAGAITSFAKKWLYFSRDWFQDRSYRVLYGDTDSLFVETGLGDDAGWEEFSRLSGALAAELNRDLGERIGREYGCASFIELRFEKAYRRLLLPPLRNRAGEDSPGEGGGEGSPDGSAPRRTAPPDHPLDGTTPRQTALRGRAKGYGGYLIPAPGSGVPAETVEVKGMEAVRSDVTALARRLQLELLELVFSGAGEEDFRRKVRETLADLAGGKLDEELVYRKRLSRPPESYTASTPPQVKAARALGWKGRRGTVEYVWTSAGAEPVSLPHHALDYRHYAQAQVLPVAKSIADAVEWDIGDFFPGKGREPAGRREREPGGQRELDFL